MESKNDSLIWINQTYKDICKVLKVKKIYPIIYCNNNRFGQVISRQYNTRIICGKKVSIKLGKWRTNRIELDEEFLNVCYDKCNNEILSPVIRTLIHEMCHIKYTKSHGKMFYDLYFRYCVKWMAYCMGKSKNEIIADKKCLQYINRFILS